MFKGFILSESLKNPVILNNYKKIYVNVEHHPESDTKYWHLFKVNISDNEIEKVAERFSKELKHGWYAHFWNGKEVYVVFEKKVFKIPQEKEWKSKEFQKLVDYGMKHDIDKKYLDFWIED